MGKDLQRLCARNMIGIWNCVILFTPITFLAQKEITTGVKKKQHADRTSPCEIR